MRRTQLVALIDPDPEKELSDESIRLYFRNADEIYVGGSIQLDSTFGDNIKGYTQRTLGRVLEIRADEGLGHIPITIFPGHPDEAQPGADGVLYLFPPNAKDPLWLWLVQIQSLRLVRGSYSDDQIYLTMYPIRGGEAARQVKAEEWPTELLIQTAEMAEFAGFDYHYLEAGSGGRIYDPKTIDGTSSVLKNTKFTLGGGIDTLEKVQMVYGKSDKIVVGTAAENKPSFIKEAADLIKHLAKTQAQV